MELTIALVLVFSLLIELGFKLSAFRVIYPFVILISHKFVMYIRAPLLIVLGFLFLCEILSIIEYSFYSSNLQSERNNIIKLIHYLGNMTILFALVGTSYLALGASTIYFALFILRCLSPLIYGTFQIAQ